MQPVRVIAGLGNPGSRYDGTRHNIGFSLLDTIASRSGVVWKEENRFCAHTVSIDLAGKPVILLKPQTFMNESGKAIQAICRFYKIHPREVVVVFDEYQIPLGEVKLSQCGGAGGHNGIQDIIERLGDEFYRLRIGIGSEEKPSVPLSDFVLGNFTEAENKIVQNRMPDYEKFIQLIFQKGPNLAMNTINTKSNPKKTNEYNNS